MKCARKTDNEEVYEEGRDLIGMIMRNTFLKFKWYYIWHEWFLVPHLTQNFKITVSNRSISSFHIILFKRNITWNKTEWKFILPHFYMNICENNTSEILQGFQNLKEPLKLNIIKTNGGGEVVIRKWGKSFCHCLWRYPLFRNYLKWRSTFHLLNNFCPF